jgi:hypothetical protein
MIYPPTKFLIDCFRHSKVDVGTHRHRHTDNMMSSYENFYVFKIRKVA